MRAAGAVDVEEESWMCAGGWEGGEVDEFLVPALWVCGARVLGGEEVREAWIVFGISIFFILGSIRMLVLVRNGFVPKCGGKGDVYFLQPPVGDVVDGLGYACWQWWYESGFVSFEPA